MQRAKRATYIKKVNLLTCKEYMVNAISVGKMPIRMKLGEDVDLKASYKINYF